MSGAEGVPREWLARSPFTDYFVPSLILFAIVGGTLTAASVMVSRRHPLARASALSAATVLLGWIVAQVAIIGYVSWMQPATFATGLFILVLALRLSSPSAANVATKPGKAHLN
jgi:hypothetical protein